MRVASACALAGVAYASAWAAPASGTLRADRVGDEIALEWGAGVGPYAIYRGTSPEGLVGEDHFHAVTYQTTWAEFDGNAPGSLWFYAVDDSFRCAQDVACDNANACDGAETCFETACFPGVAIDCWDGDACTVDTCDPATGTCGTAPLDCDDGDWCTADSCDPVLGCRYEVDPLATIGQPVEIAGNALADAPYFDFVRSFNRDAGVQGAIDPSRSPLAVGKTCDVYVVEGRGAAEWCDDRTLVDVRGAPETRTFVAGDVRDNTFLLVAPSSLPSTIEPEVGQGYDVVLDCNRDGALGLQEYVDGLGDRHGFYLLGDLTAPGPFAVAQFDEIGPAPNYCDALIDPGADDMRLYYPSVLDSPAATDRFPLVMISHGNGHCYDWYDFLGSHLASYGYVVVAFDTDVRPGIDAAATSLLNATDRVLLEQAFLGTGVLGGHIDGGRIAWIGHSRGGEAVVRAYDRLRDGDYTPNAFGAEDILAISSIAPTDFLGTDLTDPHDSNYHLLYGSADGDVCGCPLAQHPFAVFERATGNRHSTYIQGADHNDFNCCGLHDFAGPPETEIGREEAQRVQKVIQLATIERYLDGSDAAEDLFWRQTETFRPTGIAPTTVITNDYRVGDARRVLVLDDFQTETDPAVASSGGVVTTDVTNLVEDRMGESDRFFEWDGTYPMNGMTRAEETDSSRGAVFEFGASGPASWEVAVPSQSRDFSAAGYLSMRAAQGTRHPATVAELGDLTFAVTLVDGAGRASSIRIGAYGGGIEEPYQRVGFGEGAGWANEFETIRIRVTDFAANGSALDLTDIAAVRLEFGGAAGSAQGRLALDDIELVVD